MPTSKPEPGIRRPAVSVPHNRRQIVLCCERRNYLPEHRRGAADRLRLPTCPWSRMLPNALLPWKAVYGQMRRWLASGVFERMAQDLREILRWREGRAEQSKTTILDSRPCSPARVVQDHSRGIARVVRRDTTIGIEPLSLGVDGFERTGVARRETRSERLQLADGLCVSGTTSRIDRKDPAARSLSEPLISCRTPIYACSHSGWFLANSNPR